MDDPTGQLESRLQNRTLQSNLSDLQKKVESGTDWRPHFRENPGMFIAAAVGGGVLLWQLLGRKKKSPVGSSEPEPATSTGRREPGELRQAIDEIKGALIGFAAAQTKNFIDRLIPGFAEHLSRSAGQSHGSEPPPSH